MKKSLCIGCLLILLCVRLASGQGNSSIPVDSWIYNTIQQLQTRGYLLDLSPGFKPYRRLEVAEAVKKLNAALQKSSASKMERWLIQKLTDEFSYEINILDANAANPDTSFTGLTFSEEAFLNFAKGDYKQFKYAGNLEFRPTLRSEIGINVGNHLLLYTDGTIDQTLRDDTIYTHTAEFGAFAPYQQAYGTSKFGLDVLHQQAYVQYSDDHLDLTFGRDYLSWGYGDDGTVLISPTAGAFDMVAAFVKTKIAKFNWFVAQLNQMPEFTPDSNNLQDTGQPSTWGQTPPFANRYLTGSRIEFNISNRVFLGGYQAAEFGGVNSPIDLEDINPVRVTYETETNDNKDLNAFLGFDVSVFYPKNFNMYGDLMIDDWQVNHDSLGDLKPNLYAVDIGLRASDILQNFDIEGTDANLQFTMVRNRVYNEYNWSSFEKLMLRNYPVATAYGDDFWSLDLRLSHWLTYRWKLGIEIMHLEHGDQNIYGLYTMPWLTNPDITVQTGYSEPFPYGVIQETNLFQANAMYQPSHDLYGEAMISYSHNRNYQYIAGVNKGIFSFLFTIYYNFSAAIPFQ